MSRKTFVLDTNVFLHDPDAIKTFENQEIVIPLAVLEELGMMKRFQDELAKNARSVLRYFASLKEIGEGDLHKGVVLKNGTRIRIQLEAKLDSHPDFAFSLKNTHYRILTTAYALFSKGEKVVFVSKDLSMRVKAEAMGLESQDYENQKFSYDSLYRGYRKIELPKHDIDLFFKDGVAKIPSPEQPFLPNEYTLMHSPEKTSAVGKYEGGEKVVKALRQLPADIWGLKPLNIEQRCALDLLLRDDVKLVTLIGPAGTGKTLLALAAGLRKVFDESTYTKILVSRPIVPLGKDIGYLPGLKEEKINSLDAADL